jgi:tetratricopeptide (TPR) repeat protein
LLLLVLLGCGPTMNDRVRQYNEDGVYLYGRGEYVGARDSFEAALTLTPDDPHLVYNIGQCYDRLGDWPRAEKYYRQCVDKSSNHAECRHALAVLLERTGRRIEANRMVEEWLTQEPELADAYAEDGWRLRQQGALPQAQGRLQQALSLDPQNIRALTELGILYEQMHMPERALVLYERVLARDPRQTEVAERLTQLRSRQVGRPLPY